ncbi:MAG: hypothetical protein ACE14S_12080 [Candidatus Bathyarchaeia archaeon]
MNKKLKVKMVNKKRTIAAIVLTVLMVSTAFFVFSNSETSIANAQTSIPANLLQYEWPNGRSKPQGAFFSDGPGPSSPGIQWKTKIPYVGGTMAAFQAEDARPEKDALA